MRVLGPLRSLRRRQSSCGWRLASCKAWSLTESSPSKASPSRRPRWRLAVASTPAGAAVDGRAPGSGIRGGLHAGTVRPAAIGGGRRAGCPCPLRGLSLPERLAPRRPTARNLPVMVWIHGGGFVGGSSSSPNTSGVGFAKQGVILVAMNYRVGRFGFFAYPALSTERPDETKGNYAYMDQIAALHWVRRNIAAFGGNPGNVTIFGFSAVASPFTAAGFAAGAWAVFRKPSPSPAAPGTARSPPGRCVRMASIGIIRCQPRRSGSSSRDRWGSKARTRTLWPRYAASAPTRFFAALRPARDQRAVLRDDADP